MYSNGFLSRGFTERRQILHGSSAAPWTILLSFWGVGPGMGEFWASTGGAIWGCASCWSTHLFVCQHHNFQRSKHTQLHKFLIFFICSRVSSSNLLYGWVVERQRLVATWLHFSRAWWMIQLISGKKDWKHVPVQKVITLNICCNVACLTFHLPHTTTSSFQSHQCKRTTGSFQIHQRSEKRTYLQSDENVVHFTR